MILESGQGHCDLETEAETGGKRKHLIKCLIYCIKHDVMALNNTHTITNNIAAEGHTDIETMSDEIGECIEKKCFSFFGAKYCRVYS